MVARRDRRGRWWPVSAQSCSRSCSGAARAAALTPAGQGFSVGLANLYLDNPEPDAAARQLLEAAPEVLVLTELTTDLLARFDAAARPRPLSRTASTGILSTVSTRRGSSPSSRSRPRRCTRPGALQVVDAVVDVPGGEVRVVAAHPEAPTSATGSGPGAGNSRDLRALMAAGRRRPSSLGDLNAGTLQPPYEALLTTPFRDAHDLFGSSLAPSWGVAPSFPRWVPTFVARLDHLLVGPAVDVVALRTSIRSDRITDRSWRRSRSD